MTVTASYYASRHTFGAKPEAYLCNKGDDEYADEQRVAMQSGEDVMFAVDLAWTNLVEERHHDESVENDREMLIRRLEIVDVPAAVDVQQALACFQTTTKLVKQYWTYVWPINEEQQF